MGVGVVIVGRDLEAGGLERVAHARGAAEQVEHACAPAAAPRATSTMLGTSSRLLPMYLITGAEHNAEPEPLYARRAIETGNVETRRRLMCALRGRVQSAGARAACACVDAIEQDLALQLERLGQRGADLARTTRPGPRAPASTRRGPPSWRLRDRAGEASRLCVSRSPSRGTRPTTVSRRGHACPPRDR